MDTRIRALTLFNERVDRLMRSDLAKRMANPQYTLDYEKMIRREWISVDGVTEDTVDAFVLNIRLLVQDQDGFSIRCLAENVYSHDSVPDDLRSHFDQHRQRWREYIDSESIYRHPLENRSLANGEIFDVLMYGGLAHVNRDKADLFYILTKQGAFSSLICSSFLSSLRFLFGVVQAIREINVKLLRHWGC